MFYEQPVWQANFTSSSGRAESNVNNNADPSSGFPFYISSYFTGLVLKMLIPAICNSALLVMKNTSGSSLIWPK